MEYYELKLRIPKQPLRLLRFRISTFLLLTAILALVLAWRRDHNLLASRLYRIQNPDASWGINQLKGPPDTTGPGDISTAWASAEQDNQKEWLDLEYDKSVVPTAILVHETYNPGAVIKVTHVTYWGSEKVLWEGTDPTPAGTGSGMSRLPVTAGIRTGRIKVYIDSPAVPGWNEIDAVGLEYGSNRIIWAKEATASSCYANRFNNGYGTEWSGLMR